MANLREPTRHSPTAQHNVRACCVHPNGGFREFRKEEVERSIASVFEQQVAKYPGRIAVKTRHEALTYDALNVAANRAAGAILARSGEGDRPVGLLFGQTSAAVAVTLGVLKAGRAYIPLEPSYPAARLIDILDHSKTGLIVTDSTNLSLAKELGQSRPLLSVDELDNFFPTAPPPRSRLQRGPLHRSSTPPARPGSRKGLCKIIGTSCTG